MTWTETARRPLTMNEEFSAFACDHMPVNLAGTRGMFADQRILAWYDGTQTSKKGILAAAELARIGSRKLIVLLPLREQNSCRHLHEQVAHFLKGKEIQLTFVRIDDPDKGKFS